MKVEDKKEPIPVIEIPWDLITEDRLIKHGYSGIVVKALRVHNNMTVRQLAERLRVRRSTIEKIENTPRIGIKLAKELSYIFKIENWRLLRKPPPDFKLKASIKSSEEEDTID